MLITIGGRARHGKDTVANVLATELNLETYALAQPIKCMVHSLVAKSGEPLPEDKEKVIPKFGVSLRTMYQTIGDWGRSFDPEFWLKLGSYDNTVVTDVRFKNELEFLRNKNCVSIYVYRPGCNIVSASHSSERWIDTVEALYYHDIIVFNNGTLNDLEHTATNLARYLSGQSILGQRAIDIRSIKSAPSEPKRLDTLCPEDSLIMGQNGYSAVQYFVPKQ